MNPQPNPVAVVTGASRGLGRAIARELSQKNWTVIADARDGASLGRAAKDLGDGVIAITGDIADPAHRQEIAEAVARVGRLDLLVNNAGVLGPSPQPPLDSYPLETLELVYRVNVVAQLGLIQQLLPALTKTLGIVINITSDAAVEPYAGWGGYGSSKAALDQLTAVLAAENSSLRVYAFDPGDMRTQMHQEAFPGENISDRPEPETVVPSLLRLIEQRPPSGRYRASELLAGPERVH